MRWVDAFFVGSLVACAASEKDELVGDTGSPAGDAPTATDAALSCHSACACANAPLPVEPMNASSDSTCGMRAQDQRDRSEHTVRRAARTIRSIAAAWPASLRQHP